MASATLNARVDSDVKERFDQTAEALGITASAAINVFARQFIAHGGFPFDVTLPKYVDFEDEGEVADLMDELSAEVLCEG